MIRLKDILKETTKTEYIVWGVPPGKKDEQILFTNAKSMSEAKKVIEILAQKHGCKKCRVQTIDLSQDTDFSQEFGKTINEEIESKKWDNITDRIFANYDNVIRIEPLEDYRGDFIRVIFGDYAEAIEFYNNGHKLLSNLVKIQRSASSSSGPKINGRHYIVSYKIIK